MSKKVKVGRLLVEVVFTEYDKKTKEEKEVPVPDITVHHRASINRGLDSADSGEFFKFENLDTITTGTYTVVDTTEEEN